MKHAAFRLASAALCSLSLMAGTVAASPETDAVQQQFGSYTVERAAQEGYALDAFCLDAAAFGLSIDQGAMGYHATNESLLMGPIDANRPQAMMFDAHGQILGVEYEVMTHAVAAPPELFEHTLAPMASHPGVEHEHYALHLWFIDNPAGEFADFNPNVSCPPVSAPTNAPNDDPMHHMPEMHH